MAGPAVAAAAYAKHNNNQPGSLRSRCTTF